ncbi:unnamed protein product, partial [Ectocarpus sp. 12 AP-2014]
ETVDGEKQKGGKDRRHKDKRKDKRKDKKKKSSGHDDTEEPSSKRRKHQASAGGDGGMDWIDAALTVGDGKEGRSGEGEEPTAEEIAAKNREEVKLTLFYSSVQYCRRAPQEGWRERNPFCVTTGWS